MSHLYLIGFMGAGKSTVGRLISDRMRLPFVDMDAEIEGYAHTSIQEIFDRDGEDEFRRIETTVLEQIALGPDSIVACGGGVVVRDQNRVILKDTGQVAYLRVGAGEAVARIGDTATRPLLSGTGGHVAATALLDAREALYSAVSDHEIDTSGRTPEEVADLIAVALSERGTQ